MNIQKNSESQLTGSSIIEKKRKGVATEQYESIFIPRFQNLVMNIQRQEIEVPCMLSLILVIQNPEKLSQAISEYAKKSETGRSDMLAEKMRSVLFDDTKLNRLSEEEVKELIQFTDSALNASIQLAEQTNAFNCLVMASRGTLTKKVRDQIAEAGKFTGKGPSWAMVIRKLVPDATEHDVEQIRKKWAKDRKILDLIQTAGGPEILLVKFDWIKLAGFSNLKEWLEQNSVPIQYLADQAKSALQQMARITQIPSLESAAQGTEITLNNEQEANVIDFYFRLLTC